MTLYRTYNGRCNNLQHPQFGSAGQTMITKLPQNYGEGREGKGTEGKGIDSEEKGREYIVKGREGQKKIIKGKGNIMNEGK